MRPYEVVVIFDSGTDPPAIQAVVDRALDTVRSTGGAPVRWTGGASASSPTR